MTPTTTHDIPSDAPNAMAYRLRAEGRGWPEIAVLAGYASGQIAAKAARRYARATGRVWPVPCVARVPATPSQPAYALRLAGKSWEEIAKATGIRNSAYALRLARDHAAAHQLPWPILVRTADADGRGKLAFELRQQGRPWVEVAVLAGYTGRTSASEAARRHAERERARQRPPEVLTDPELHAAYLGGESMTSLADRLQQDRRTLHLRIAAYVKDHGLADPRLFNRYWSMSHPERADRMRRAYELRAEGLVWAEVAARLGYAGVAQAVAGARAHALEQHLAWPLPRSRHRASGQPAYELRLAGRTWPEIAQLLGYVRADWAMTMARRHAHDAGLPWPVPVADQQRDA